MNEFTLDELNLLLSVFEKAGITVENGAEGEMLQRVKAAQENRQELDSMEFDDCLGGACKL
ncbi:MULTISPECIES: hypothetical protein [unclassified Neptuniibacter]|uniref:hypothetical protein n=1 Tax=unclassified Neptuniibacter TaxID=2630693 RepID=UPI000C5D2D42|nr:MULTISPECIES: hypothetical protein [unclassified Neptuniibacter]MAY43047.1 hypothetical protein [Oceanospirillaceae bacterium]|tara:strand:- start:6894 stop:7076 length:183 start_codon:yes stop_codon:yes gene_type:complete